MKKRMNEIKGKSELETERRGKAMAATTKIENNEIFFECHILELKTEN